MGGAFGGTDTGLSWSGPLVGEGELAEVASDHVELDFDVGENFAIVDCDLVADHLRHDDAVSEVGFDWDRLLAGHA